MFSLIWHSIIRRKVLSLSTIATVALSTGILFALYLLNIGVSAGLETGKSRLGTDLLVVPSGSDVNPEDALFTGAPLNVYMARDIESEIKAIPGVQHVSSQFFTQTLSEDCCSLSDATRLIGFDSDTDQVLRAWLKGGIKNTLDPNEILIGSDIQGYSGSEAFILDNKFVVAGVLEPTGTGLDYSILMPVESARRLARANPYLKMLYWDKIGNPEDLISATLVKTDASYPKERIAEVISGLGGVKVIKPSDVLQNVKGQMDVLFMIILGVGLLTAASSGFLLFARFYALVWERKGEWGLYRALGATRRDLKLLVTGEALLLTLAGTLAGVAAGGVLYRSALELLQKQKAFPFIGPSLVPALTGAVMLIVLFSLVGLLSAWFPASRSGRIEPSKAMAIGDID
ncbi:MAG TPA: ABC transporter permease [Pelotomaculum sp.]|nr:ABC transporter permease [Pelotomaculum sp.]